ncbi:hypothetical protein BN440_0918 [Erwinia amylovora MR1]|nr:hypothetical protein BN440_0918 [Erwinia amylovora MR1]
MRRRRGAQQTAQKLQAGIMPACCDDSVNASAGQSR